MFNRMVFDRLTITNEILERKTDKHRFFQCVCVCGNSCIVSMNHLKTGHTTSCGCKSKEGVRLRHGHARKNHLTTEYRIWLNMKDRCSNPNTPSYKDYGGRGIYVCSEWAASFEAFFASVGHRPSKALSLDRINNNGPYEPGNVRWATWREQRLNARKPSHSHSKALVHQPSKKRI